MKHHTRKMVQLALKVALLILKCNRSLDVIALRQISWENETVALYYDGIQRVSKDK